MWPFILTRIVTTEKTIAAPKSDVLRILHNPHEVLANNAMVVSVVQDTSDPSRYTITDRVPLIGSWATHTTIKTQWKKTTDGCDIEVYASLWTRLKNELRVRELDAEGNTVLLFEKVVVKGLFIFIPFIVSTTTKGHRDFMDTLAMKLESTLMLTWYLIDDSIYYILVTSIGLFFAVASWLRMRNHHHHPINTKNDPYGLFHLSLNKLPFEDPNSLPATEWLNMGYWKDARTFPEACKALALKMISAAHLKEGGTILDVGHGTGESLILLLSDPSIPRPSRLIGITSLDIHYHRSRDRVDKLQAADQNKVSVDLHHRDAVFDGVASSSHPLNPSSATTFDSILALDCAYHFNTRYRFLEQSFQKLTPGGSIALADICFSSSSLNTRRTRLITSILSLIPTYNRISAEDYVDKMKQIGYIDVILEDVTLEVFPGFVPFLKSRGWKWWAFGTVIEWYSSTGARFVIVSGKRPSL
ncbi:S-adenosyl-L-methionine-dependent methyltransferase [Phlegmacium glaucopus]|nr:S-adenosyl-L-methionine-dependent methyltransferase [Phlegmacium glaucopus]